MSEPSKAPVPKVIAASVGAAAATAICLIYALVSGNNVPAGLEGALATLIAFGAGYLTSDNRPNQ